MAAPREQSEMDVALLGLVRAALAPYGPDCADLRQLWVDPADMWFVELTPRRGGAAPISLAFDGRDLVSVTVGNTWFELFPVRTEEHLAEIAQIVADVLAGRVREAGLRSDSYAWIGAPGRARMVGAAHLPRPMWARRIRRYEPYGPA